MENKKLLSYLLKDLEELDELFSEKADFRFDEMEIEFIQTRIKGARKLVQKYIEAKEVVVVQKPVAAVQEVRSEAKKTGTWEETVVKMVSAKVPNEQEPAISQPEPIKETVAKEIPKPEPVIKTAEEEKQKKQPLSAPGVIVKEIVNYVDETIEDIDNEEFDTVETVKSIVTAFENQELKFEDKSEENSGTRRLGDSFTKDRSLNDFITDDSVKLEHKLSNMPVSSLQSAIGINDRFQYIRELFDGNSDLYNETVTKLDSMNEIKDAVVYLQNNFKWKKTEISLKFVNLLKRRFPNE
jgi:hypothetical protein